MSIHLKEILEDMNKELGLEASFLLTSTGLILEGFMEDWINYSELNNIKKKIDEVCSVLERDIIKNIKINYENYIIQLRKFHVPELNKYFLIVILSKDVQLKNLGRYIGKLIEWVISYFYND